MGAGLSAGQSQRIALARALYGKPCMLVLDEPNAFLDNHGEMALLAAVKAARARNATVIIIAHRRGVLEAADRASRARRGPAAHDGPGARGGRPPRRTKDFGECRVTDAVLLPTPLDLEAGNPRAEIRTGAIIAIFFFVVLLGWAALAPLDAGVTASGTIAVSGNRQSVQNRDGGVVKAINVREGQHVEAGEVLV